MSREDGTVRVWPHLWSVSRKTVLHVIGLGDLEHGLDGTTLVHGAVALGYLFDG